MFHSIKTNGRLHFEKHPELSEKFINITVFYPGASPKEMEEGITIRIEEALGKGAVMADLFVS